MTGFRMLASLQLPLDLPSSVQAPARWLWTLPCQWAGDIRISVSQYWLRVLVFVNLLEKQQSPTSDHCHVQIAVPRRSQTVDGGLYFNNSRFHGSTLSSSALPLSGSLIEMFGTGTPSQRFPCFCNPFIVYANDVFSSVRISKTAYPFDIFIPPVLFPSDILVFSQPTSFCM